MTENSKYNFVYKYKSIYKKEVKNMKKIIALLLAIAMCLSFCACGNNDDKNNNSNNDGNSNNNAVHTHTWIPATCEQLKQCSTCGIETGMLAEHTWNDATCIALKTCSVCKKTDGDFADHDYQENITVEATCTSEGILTKTCNVCNDSVEETIEKTMHDTTEIHKYKNICSTCGFEDYTIPCALALIDYIPKLKSPESLSIDAIYAGEYNREDYNSSETGKYVAVIFQASAKNSYNATVTNVYVYIYEVDGTNVVKDLKATGEYLNENYTGVTAINGILMKMEASLLISKATTDFVKQDDALILYLALNQLSKN